MPTKGSIKTLLKMTERAGIENLLDWMVKNGFFESPCSSKYHLAQPGGLAEHSLNVYRNAIQIVDALYVKQQKEITFNFIHSVTICALLHDLGKCGQFGKPNYKAIEDDSGVIGYETNKDLLYIPHEIRSIVIASKFIDLTEEEQFAILYHNSLYGELQGFKGKETPLLLILHHADMWAARITDSEDRK